MKRNTICILGLGILLLLAGCGTGGSGKEIGTENGSASEETTASYIPETEASATEASSEPSAGTEEALSQSDPASPPSSLKGVDLSVKSVEDGAVTVVITNDTDKEVTTGSDFSLQRLTDAGWQEVEKIIDDWAFDSLGSSVAKNGSSEFSYDYEWLYGTLDSGQYRIIKNISVETEPGTSESYAYDAEFTIGNHRFKLEYGTSSIYTKSDMDAAISVILEVFQEWEELGCELHSIRYASDSCNSVSNIKWMNDLSENGTVYTQCIEFFMDYHSPSELIAGTGWNPDCEYKDYRWWLARSDGGSWDLMTSGY